jgi:hypothetical protein
MREPKRSMRGSAAALVFMILAGVVCARAEPVTKENLLGEWPLKPIGPPPEVFTKDFETRQCGKRYCWKSLKSNHFYKGFEHGPQPTVNSDACRKSRCT